MNDIIIRGLNKSFSVTGDISHSAIRDLHLTIVPGSFNVIVGKSGCGKTTLLRIIAGLDQSDSGEIANLPQRKKCSLMFQSPRFLPWLTIWENVTFWEHGHFTPAEIAEAKKEAEYIKKNMVYLGFARLKKPDSINPVKRLVKGMVMAFCKMLGYKYFIKKILKASDKPEQKGERYDLPVRRLPARAAQRKAENTP